MSTDPTADRADRAVRSLTKQQAANVEAVIRVRIGRVRRLAVLDHSYTYTPPPAALENMFVIKERRFKSDFDVLMSHAEQITGQRFDVYRTDSGRPGHFTIAGGRLPKPQIVYHAAQVGYTGLLSVAIRRQLHAPHLLPADFVTVVTQVCLRVAADHLLYEGKVDEAMACLGKARAGLSESYLDTVHVRLPSTLVEQEEREIFCEAYVPLVFQGLAHECGHHARDGLRHRLDTDPRLQLEAIIASIRQNIDFANDPTNFALIIVPSDIRGHEEWARAQVSQLIAASAEDWARQLRDEITADLIAISILWRTCCDLAKRQGDEQLRFEYFVYEVLVSQFCLSLLHGVAALARRHAAYDKANEEIAFIEIMVGILTRFFWTMRALLDRDLRESLGIVVDVSEDRMGALVAPASSLLQPACNGLMTADEFVKSDDIRDRRWIGDVIDADSTLASDADIPSFVRLADEFGLQSPDLDGLRSMTDRFTRSARQ